MNDNKKKELFKEFLSKNLVLIVDKSTASRRRLAKTLTDLGGKRHQIESFAHLDEAMEVIKKKTPGLILSDFAIGGGSGFDLFKRVHEAFPKEKKMCCILITSNISQSAVAKAAEEDVDSFIIKPYTVQSLEGNLINTVINKLYPSKYVETIDKGKALMLQSKFEEALTVFDEAIKMHTKPALALFYHGQAQYMMEVSKEAMGDYKKGLSFNNIHFKCQVGLFEIFMKEERYEDAYSVVKNIAKYFPANPDRLTQVIRLAVQTGNFTDMDDYYEIFKGLEERSEEVIRFMSAGMYVAGKFHMSKGNAGKAIEVFDNLAVSCQGIPRFIRGIITTLVQYDMAPESQKFVSRFTPDAKSGMDYKIAAYLAESKTMSNGLLIKGGLEIFNSSQKDLHCFEIMVKTMVKENYGEKVATIIEDAKKVWPDKDFTYLFGNVVPKGTKAA